MTANTRT